MVDVLAAAYVPCVADTSGAICVVETTLSGSEEMGQ